MRSTVPAKSQVNLSYRNLVPDESDRVQISWVDIVQDKGNVRRFVRVLRYVRFIGDGTELWFFGSGLGDQAIVHQMGESFFKYLERDDPCLGRLMFSVGIGPYAFHPWTGDFNLYWAWGGVMEEDWLENYSKTVSIQPQLYLCPSKTLMEHVEDAGKQTLYLPAGVGNDFKPLHLPREGLAYAGGASKSKEQIDAVLGPFLKRPDFVWHGKSGSNFMNIEDLNEWYNRKKILFGMKLEANDRWRCMSNRLTETLASGTPLVQFGYEAIDETLGFHYPYQTYSREETVEMVDGILGDYSKVLREFEGYSKRVRRDHSYMNRLEVLFKRLEEMR